MIRTVEVSFLLILAGCASLLCSASVRAQGAIRASQLLSMVLTMRVATIRGASTPAPYARRNSL